MNEIERRAERAQYYRRRLCMINVNTQWRWCVHTGLWETAGWIGGNVIRWVEAPGRDRRS